MIPNINDKLLAINSRLCSENDFNHLWEYDNVPVFTADYTNDPELWVVKLLNGNKSTDQLDTILQSKLVTEIQATNWMLNILQALKYTIHL